MKPYKKNILLALYLLLFVFSAKAQNWKPSYDKATDYFRSENYEKALLEAQKGLILFEKSKIQDSSYSNLLSIASVSCFQLQKYKESLPYFQKEYKWRIKNQPENHEDLLGCSEDFAEACLQAGQYSQASTIATQLAHTQKRFAGAKSTEYGVALLKLAEAQKEMGFYEVAQKNFIEVLDIFEKKTGKKSEEYLGAINNFADFYWKKGAYTQAEPLFLEALKLTQEVFANDSQKKAIVMGNLGNLYLNMGLYEEAQKIFDQQLPLAKQTFGEKNLNFANNLNNFAVFQRKTNHFDTAEQVYLQALEIRKTALGQKHPIYAQSLSNLAELYVLQGKYIQAEPLFVEALAIRKETLGQKHPNYAQTLHHYAQLLKYTNRIALAEKTHLQALEIRKIALGQTHPRYAQSTYSLATLYWAKKDVEKAEIYFKKALDSYLEQIKLYFAGMSEQERIQFYSNQVRPVLEAFYVFTTQNNALNPSFTTICYKYHLLTKGILLYATQKVRQQILNSGNEQLITQYNTWIGIKEQLANLYTLSKEELKRRGENLEKLQEVSLELEKELSVKSQGFKKTYEWQNASFEEVKAFLKPQEAAVEVLRTRFFDAQTDTFKDSVQYVFLIVKNSSQTPEIVILNNGNDLEKDNISYYGNCIRFKKLDKKSFELFFEPIQRHLQGISKVYLSADGVYNKLNLQTLYDTKNKKYLSEEIDVQLLTNTKDLLVPSDSKENIGIHLFGFPNYNLGNNPNNPQKDIAQNSSKAVLDKTIRGDLDRYSIQTSFVVELPGTKLEVENIGISLRRKFSEITSYLGDNAIESSIKKINNPYILHIATHGFFLPDDEKTLEKTFMQPLFRSGLILAGANRLLGSQNTSPDEEDGILTAYEVCNLYLDNTNLVVLSACQTGLGDIVNGEGVFGLQRAFRVAGAKSLIMSLWKVDDAATQELMSSLYEGITAGKTTYEAFNEAKKETKKKYPDPYYWGAFVMVGQ